MAAREAPAMAGAAPAWRADPDKPWFHVMPRDGWLNDPNGPLFHHGRYHVFYQHVVGSSEWAWACSWAHASSADLVAWRHEPIALQPSPGALDAAGCWSGTVAVSDEGKPTMLYTAVRLRSDPRSEPLPPPGHDIGLDMIECQCCAACPADDTDLIQWAKAEEPIIQYPPGGMALEGFRDPYVIQQGGLEQPWRIILGSGIKGRGGTLLVYESQHLTHGWKYQGELTSGTSRPCGTCDLGAMWECPFFLRLSESLPGQPGTPALDPNSSCAVQNSEASTGTHVLCVSPYPHHVEGRPTNPCLYWLGPYQAAKFDLEAAAGPFQLDLGDILYAPNTLSCPDGRTLLLAWLQELRSGGGFKYAGCLSIPRLITLQGGRLHQEPAAEVAQLRMAPSWRVASLDVTPMAGSRIPDVAGPSCDVTFVLEPRGCRRAGLLIRAWLQPGPNTGNQPAAAAVVVDWEEAQLQVLYPTLLHTQSCTFDWGQLARSVGGSIDMKSDKHVQLRILIDHSAVEVFASSGEALATRVYRGDMPASKDPGMFFVAEGGPVRVRDVEAYTMRSIWEDPGDIPAKYHEPAAE